MDGSIDWLRLPRFDSGACFARLVGDERKGHWRISPAADPRRRYRKGTLVLETDYETDEGAVRVVECMPPGDGAAGVVRVVEALRGVGFLPASYDRVRGTVEAIQRTLTSDGLVRRYSTDESDDGLPGGEGVFLPCSFWLADALALIGRQREARRLFGRLLTLRNGLGLISEEYDTKAGWLIGNFPQAFTHLALIKTAALLASRAVFEEPESDLAPAA
jgi:GH15 family glucan-1,4-alpha-glucosidase